MAAAALTQARTLVFNLSPEDQVDLASAIVNHVAKLPSAKAKKPTAKSVRQKVGQLSKAIGSPLTGKALDARLRKAVSGKEQGVPASVTVKETRKRLGL